MSGARPFIVVGDKTDHGGEVLEGSPKALINGKMIARVGDKVHCPRSTCRGTQTITECDPTVIVDGKAAAFHGGLTSCGARLIASMVDNTIGGSDDSPMPPERDWSVKAASGMAESAGYAPSHQAATTSGGRQPTEVEIRQYMNANYAKRDITRWQNTNLAINNKAIAIVREDKTVTLRATVTVAGNRADEASAAIQRYWDKLSFTDSDGVTYKSDIRLSKAPEQSAIIRLKWVTLSRSSREQGMPNGDILLNKDNEAADVPIDPRMIAHEFGHAFFGLKDGYEETVTMPNGTAIKSVPYPGLEGSIMADIDNGVVRLQDLKALIASYGAQLP